MEFDKLKTDIKNADLDTIRTDEEDYFEVVIKKNNLEAISRILESMLGQPAWPSSNKLSKEVSKLIRDFGGIRNGQMLYFLKDGDISVFAMLWPWQDGERVTLKIAKA